MVQLFNAVIVSWSPSVNFTQIITTLFYRSSSLSSRERYIDINILIPSVIYGKET